MGATAVIGGQWGDEGKGKIIDLLAESSDFVVRYSGGNNAGHTVINHLGEFWLHVVPAGIFNENTQCVIGNGVALDPNILISELDQLEKANIDVSRLVISDRAHIVFPFHRLLDSLEESRLQDKAIGTTKRGIGPTFVDKTARRGVRMGDLLDRDNFREKVTEIVEYVNVLLEKVYRHEGVDIQELFDLGDEWTSRLSHSITQTEILINSALNENKEVLLEGAQGTLLDLDFGTYPYVTSSHPGVSGAYQGAGIGPVGIDRIVGVFKAYCTRVGAGPFPTELLDDVGEKIRSIGGEYGTTTNRPRRIGWFDVPMARLSNVVNGYTSIILTRLDVLDSMDQIDICTGYKVGEETIEYPPSGTHALDNCEPIYETIEGWNEPTSAVRHFQDLPPKAKLYVERLQELMGVPVSLLSVGPRRDENIIVRPAL